MSYDDFLFYLPGYASVPIILAGTLSGWLAWRLIRAYLKKRRKPGPVENSPKT